MTQVEQWTRVSRRDSVDIMAIAEGLNIIRRNLPPESAPLSREDDMRMRAVVQSAEYGGVRMMFERYASKPAQEPAGMRYCGGEIAFEIWPRDKI